MTRVEALLKRVENWVEAFLNIVGRYRRIPYPILLGIALAILSVVLYLAWPNAKESLNDLEFGYLIAALLIVPLQTVLNAYEIRLTGEWLHAPVGKRDSLAIAILGSTANLLPLPGGTVVRMTEFQARGVSVGTVTRATVILGAILLSVGLLAAGATLGFATQTIGWAVLIFILVGAGFGAISAILARPLSLSISQLGPGILIEVGIIAVSTARYGLILLALNANPSLGEAVNLALASVFATVLSVFPAGIGARELIAGAMAPIAGTAPAIGVVAAFLNRILGLLVLAPFALGSAVATREKSKA